MAGHSKWANIKHKKAAVDKKRGKAFTQLSKEITVSVRLGGGQPTNNPRLRQLMEKARDINMPMENITRAIKRGTGELPGVNYEAQLYEGYGPHGIAVMVEALTDKKNRTVADIRNLFSKGGGNLAEGGAVSWMFKKLGVVRAEMPENQAASEDQLLEQLIDYDINDISITKRDVIVSADPKSLEGIKQTLEAMGMRVTNAELEWVANELVALDGSGAERAIDFLDTLEEHEDVQNVYTNLA